jgi:hypothetical protein
MLKPNASRDLRAVRDLIGIGRKLVPKLDRQSKLVGGRKLLQLGNLLLDHVDQSNVQRTITQFGGKRPLWAEALSHFRFYQSRHRLRWRCGPFRPACSACWPSHAPSTKEAAIWTAVWVALSLGFNALVWLDRSGQALEFLISYLVEYSLGVDNIFVFVLVFSYFAVPAAYQRRVLFWGILIGAGVAFAGTFHWALDLFGAFLLFTGIKMFFSRGKAVDIARNPLIRLLRSLLPVSDTYKTRASPFGTITGCC